MGGIKNAIQMRVGNSAFAETQEWPLVKNPVILSQWMCVSQIRNNLIKISTKILRITTWCVNFNQEMWKKWIWLKCLIILAKRLQKYYRHKINTKLLLIISRECICKIFHHCNAQETATTQSTVAKVVQFQSMKAQFKWTLKQKAFLASIERWWI